MFKNLLYLAIFTSFVVVSWIGFEVYNSSVTSTITPDKSIIITPIPASFDMGTIISIKSKKIIPADLSQNASRSAVPVPSVAPQSTSQIPATNSAVPNAIPTSSQTISL